ncbi:50S ribosomal protein L11 methyltransferase [Aerolutibacter ruishenii]|uniref:Ribosomal protein L11 methyltransferase n=1 Tax=Aerolutibacter ruishenii TaxID=686800 RepID=A0A562LRR2_9GAMM|nr:50S ribosomal protein L11 methyltransferase [Lysobacter ruishenii]TWI10331.1 ribosomal protein L11 methyltransferase [Lysobacter ruishenii]
MPFLELSLPCTETQQPRYERALEDVGALAVTLADAHADAPDEQAIFEPGVGEQPLWNELVLTALFEGGTSETLLLYALSAADEGLDWSRARFREVEDQDWERAWMDQYEPLRFGERTWIVPWDADLPADAQAQLDAATGDAVPAPAIVRLDPGLAFGSGTHPTTALCLQWLDGLANDGALRDARVLDFGCGSGILALAALKLGAARAVGVDNDPQALTATHDNAERNGVAARMAVYLPQDEPPATYPVVVANILAVALIALVDTLAARVAPGGRIALSGILAGQEDEVIAAYAPHFNALQVERLEDWIRISGTRRTTDSA